MKLKIRKVLLILFMLIIFINIGIFVKKNYDKHIYNEIIKAFIPIEIDEINENIDKGNSMYLYIGRNSCYWCRLLVSPLSEIVETKISYRNSNRKIENTPDGVFF